MGIPLAGYSPETRIMGGAYGYLMIGDPEVIHPSSIGLSLLATRNRQFSINLFPEVWWSGNKYHMKGEMKLQHWPDKFFGIGNDTETEDEESYVSRIAGVKLDLLGNYYQNLYSGALLEIEHNNIVEYDTAAHAVLPGGSIPGSSSSLITGIGFGLAWDTRTDVSYPSGAYYQLRMVYFTPLLEEQYSYMKWILDLRQYVELGGDHMLYLQLYGKFQSGGEIPFRNLSLLGGDKLLRGYFKGRYRDNHMYVAQAEYHSPYIWRLSFVGFAGIGDVFRSFSTAPGIKPSAGAGIRYRVFRDRSLNARMDFAVGKGDHGFYLGILEVF